MAPQHPQPSLALELTAADNNIAPAVQPGPQWDQMLPFPLYSYLDAVGRLHLFQCNRRMAQLVLHESPRTRLRLDCGLLGSSDTCKATAMRLAAQACHVVLTMHGGVVTPSECLQHRITALKLHRMRVSHKLLAGLAQHTTIMPQLTTVTLYQCTFPGSTSVCLQTCSLLLHRTRACWLFFLVIGLCIGVAVAAISLRDMYSPDAAAVLLGIFMSMLMAVLCSARQQTIQAKLRAGAYFFVCMGILFFGIVMVIKLTSDKIVWGLSFPAIIILLILVITYEPQWINRAGDWVPTWPMWVVRAIGPKPFIFSVPKLRCIGCGPELLALGKALTLVDQGQVQHITTDSMRVDDHLTQLPALQSVRLTGLDVTDADVVRLRTARPGLRVVVRPGGVRGAGQVVIPVQPDPAAGNADAV